VYVHIRDGPWPPSLFFPTRRDVPVLTGRQPSSRPQASLSMRTRLLSLAMSFSITGGVIASLMSGSAVAQDGTGASTPTPSERCVVIPAEVDLEPLVQEQTSDLEGTPLPSGTPEATPITETDSSPVVSEEMEPLVGEIEAVTHAIVGCLNENNITTFLSMASTTYLGQITGNSDALDDASYAALAPSFPNIANKILTITDITAVNPTTATATVTYLHSYQQRTSTWTFMHATVDGKRIWTIDSETLLETSVPDPSTAVDLTIRGNKYKLSEESISGPNIVFSMRNADEIDHEVLILRFGRGTSTDTLLQATGPAFPEGILVVGQSTLPASSRGMMVLTGVPKGTYTIVCLFPNEEGLPHLADGMTVTFEVK
jgi:hypothetical protein